MNLVPIKLGDLTKMHGKPARVTKLLPLGTIEVCCVDGQSYRLTGLWILDGGKPAWRVSPKKTGESSV